MFVRQGCLFLLQVLAQDCIYGRKMPVARCLQGLQAAVTVAHGLAASLQASWAAEKQSNASGGAKRFPFLTLLTPASSPASMSRKKKRNTLKGLYERGCPYLYFFSGSSCSVIHFVLILLLVDAWARRCSSSSQSSAGSFVVRRCSRLSGFLTEAGASEGSC